MYHDHPFWGRNRHVVTPSVYNRYGKCFITGEVRRTRLTTGSVLRAGSSVLELDGGRPQLGKGHVSSALSLSHWLRAAMRSSPQLSVHFFAVDQSSTPGGDESTVDVVSKNRLCWRSAGCFVDQGLLLIEELRLGAARVRCPRRWTDDSHAGRRGSFRVEGSAQWSFHFWGSTCSMLSLDVVTPKRVTPVGFGRAQVVLKTDQQSAGPARTSKSKSRSSSRASLNSTSVGHHRVSVVCSLRHDPGIARLGRVGIAALQGPVGRVGCSPSRWTGRRPAASSRSRWPPRLVTAARPESPHARGDRAGLATGCWCSWPACILERRGGVAHLEVVSCWYVSA